MNSYSYLVIDKQGKEKKGTMEAANEDIVKAFLKGEGNILISISPQNMLTKDIQISIGNPIKPRDLSVFCRQFVSILSAGVSIINALDMLSEQTENKVLSRSIRNVQVSVEKGETLADAMAAEKKIFPRLLMHMVEAGEASGDLEIVFERMAEHFEKDTKLKAQVKKAMIYPMVVGIVAIVVIFVMMLVVIPNFVGIFRDMNLELPAMTRMVIGMSDFVKDKWFLILLMIAFAVFGFYLTKKSDSGKFFLGKLALKLPLFGKINTKSNSSRLARTLSTLLTAGIPMIEALDITAKTLDNVIAKQVLFTAKDDVIKGLPLSNPIKMSGVFPPMVCQMIKIGEESGNLESMLEKLADYYDEEVKIATESLTAVLEPMIIVVLALVVGVLIMAIMQPMLSMYSGLDNL